MAFVVGATVTGALGVARGSTGPRVSVLCVVTAPIVLVVANAMRGARPVSSQHARGGSTSPRRARRGAFLLTSGAIAVVVVAIVLLGVWDALFAMPGLLLGALIIDVRRSGGRLVPSRPRVWVVMVLAPLLVVSWSLVNVLAPPGPDPLVIRAVEWLRDHQGADVVNSVERWWYTSHPPPVGGAPAALEAKPRVPVSSDGRGGSRNDAPLARVPSPTKSPVGDEGIWNAISGSSDHPAVATTLLRPDAVHTSLVVGLLRIDPSKTRLRLLPGTEQPDGVSPNRGEVPAVDRAHLLAAFNAGFRMQEAGGGWFSEGHTATPLQAGAASLVLRDDGRADVGQWGRDDSMGPHVVGVRQNLALIVDGGVPVVGIDSPDNARWGKTLGHRVLVARSGVGVTKDGILIYVGGPGLSVRTLAETLIAAGAVRGMELDINTQWVDAYTFHPGVAGPAGTKLVDTMRYGPDRYLSPQSRDFISVTSR